MFKPIEVTRSEIIDRDPLTGRVRLDDGRTVAGRRIIIMPDVSIEPIHSQQPSQDNGGEAVLDTIDDHIRAVSMLAIDNTQKNA